jgi:hypothetical protein
LAIRREWLFAFGTVLAMSRAKIKHEATMFRIKKIFENHSACIFKIEGKVTDENLGIWTEEINAMKKLENWQVNFG